MRQFKIKYQAVRKFGEGIDASRHGRVAALVQYFLRTVAQWIDGKKEGRMAHEILRDDVVRACLRALF
jgi:hypothetical protein